MADGGRWQAGCHAPIAGVAVGRCGLVLSIVGCDRLPANPEADRFGSAL
jgi:hypothetical protein